MTRPQDFGAPKLVTLTAALAIISVLPFLVAGSWFVRLDFAGGGPQAWLTVLIPPLLATGIIASLIIDRSHDLLPSFRSPKILGSTIVTLLLAWLTIQWLNLLLTSQYDVAAFQSVLMATAIALGVLLFARSHVPTRFVHIVFALFGTAGGLLVIMAFFFDFSLAPMESAIQYLLIPLVSVLVLGALKPWALLGVPLILQALLLTSPRMAIATAVLIVVLGAFLVPHLKRTFRAAVLLGTIAIVFVNFQLNSLLSSRFFSTGDFGIKIPLPSPSSGSESPSSTDSPGLETTNSSSAGVDSTVETVGVDPPVEGVEAPALIINTNGRNNVWNALGRELETTDLLSGKGAGYARNFVTDYAGWQQPHNEYLRLLVDFGLPGLLLLLFTGLTLLVFAMTKWKIDRATSFGIVGSLIVMGMMSLTDIPMVSYGVAVPFAIVIGSSLGELTRDEAKSIPA